MGFADDAATAQLLLEYRRIQREKQRIERDTQALMDRATVLWQQVDAPRRAEIQDLRAEFIANLRSILGV